MASKNDSDMTALGCIGAVVILPAIIVAGWLLSGWVGSSLWAWYIAPKFHVALLTWPEAVGIAIYVSYMTHQSFPTDYAKDKEEIGVGKALINVCKVLSRYPLVWFFGWIFHYFAFH